MPGCEYAVFYACPKIIAVAAGRNNVPEKQAILILKNKQENGFYAKQIMNDSIFIIKKVFR